MTVSTFVEEVEEFGGRAVETVVEDVGTGISFEPVAVIVSLEIER